MTELVNCEVKKGGHNLEGEDEYASSAHGAKQLVLLQWWHEELPCIPLGTPERPVEWASSPS